MINTGSHILTLDITAIMADVRLQVWDVDGETRLADVRLSPQQAQELSERLHEDALKAWDIRQETNGVSG